MLFLFPAPFGIMIGSEDVAQKAELLLVEHIEATEGRMVNVPEFWLHFEWELDSEYNLANEMIARGRAWFKWRGRPVVRLDYEVDIEPRNDEFIFTATNPTAQPTKLHASQEEDR